jgi:hypothetical protein
MAKSMADVMVADSAGAVGQRSRFFLVMAIVLFVPVAIGFGPTLFLRPWSGARDPLGGPFPIHLIVHGVVLSAWYLLFIVQTTLVAAHRVDLHRQLGVIGVGIAAAVVIASTVTLVKFVPRATALSIPLAQVVPVEFGDLAALVLFALFVTSAVYLRRDAAAHKRLMFLAASSIVGPAFSSVRPIGRALDPWLPGSGLLFTIACFIAVAVYDVVTRKRLHPATLFGIAMYIVAAVAVGYTAFSTNLGTAYVEWLGSGALP